MKNQDQNEDKRLQNLRPKQFSSEYQPSPEAKKAGWKRKREAQKILDLMMKLGDMSFREIKELLIDIKKHPEKHTLREVKMAQYMTKEKFIIDYLDRHIQKASTKIDLSMVTVDDLLKKLKEEEDVL